MNKILTATLCTLVLLGGCRTREISPETCWADYGRYYRPTGEKAAPFKGAANVRQVKSGEASSAVATLKTKGNVVLGSFVIADDTEISPAAVQALAQKLGASAVVWTTENTVGDSSSLPNPDIAIVGVDKAQTVQIGTMPRTDKSFMEQIITYKHTIWMLGEKSAKQ